MGIDCRAPAMLDRDQRRVLQPIQCQHEIVVAIEVIRRIGVDEIEGIINARERGEDVGGRSPCTGAFHSFARRSIAAMLRRDESIASRRRRAARQRLEREDAAAGEEIEKVRAVDAIADDVEVRLPRALGRRTNAFALDWNSAAAKGAGCDSDDGHAYESRQVAKPPSIKAFLAYSCHRTL
jgi:hypothetical protein